MLWSEENGTKLRRIKLGRDRSPRERAVAPNGGSRPKGPPVRAALHTGSGHRIDPFPRVRLRLFFSVFLIFLRLFLFFWAQLRFFLRFLAAFVFGSHCVSPDRLMY